MVKCKPRYPIKRKLAIFLLSSIIPVLIIIPNISLYIYKGKINRALNNHFIKPIAIGDIYYLPPNFILLRNISISENKENPNKTILAIPVSYLNFSLPELLLNKGFHVSSMHCFMPEVDYNNLSNFVKESYNQIFVFLQHLEKQNFTLFLHKGKLHYVKKDGIPVNYKINSKFTTVGNSILASGVIGETKFGLKIIILPERVNIEKLKLENSGLHCEISGETNKNTAEFKGFIFLNKPGLMKEPNPNNLFILNIKSRFKFNSPNVEIEYLDFSLNDNPVKLKGEISFTKPFSCNLNLLSDFRGLEDDEESVLKKISLSASLIAQEDNTLKLNSVLNIDYPPQKKGPQPIKKIVLSLKDLIMPLAEYPILNIKISGLNYFCLTGDNSYLVNLEDLRIKINEKENPLKSFNFSSRFYDGKLIGGGWIELRGFNPIINASARIKKADANKLAETLPYLSKIHGKLFAQVHFTNYPNFIFMGNMLINNGILKNSDFFVWLADLFNLPEFKEMPCRSLSANFMADKNGANLNNIFLNSTNLKLKGYLKLGSEGNISSKIYLSFPKTVLQKSPKFVPLLKLLHNINVYNFNFQLSGTLKNMNFLWLQSDFKDELEKEIPNFAKRGLEEEVERIITSISGKE